MSFDIKIKEKFFYNKHDENKTSVLKNIDIKIKDENNKVIIIKDLNFQNYCFQRNEINGIVFEKRFTYFFNCGNY